MKTPKFWQEPNWISMLLTPLGELYALATKLRLRFKKSKHVDIPVICIGNLTAGGTGKTPTAISLAVMLQSAGIYPNFLSRGYHGTLQNTQVDCTHHTPQQVGDEPLLLARIAPTFINADRYQGALMAQANQAECILMDDGFQNPTLYKDLSLLVIDGSAGFGNTKCIPAGPLREHITDGLKRAHAVLIINDEQNIAATFPLPCFKGKIVPSKLQLNNNRVVAFAGIGRPEKFFDMLKGKGISVDKKAVFPDHYDYTRFDIESLLSEAGTLPLVTTTKDAVKVPRDMQNRLVVVSGQFVFDEPATVQNMLKGILGA